MSVEFFNTPCSEKPRNEKRFGLCDDDDESPAYSSLNNEENWIATVESTAQEVVFTPIDKCIVPTKEGSTDKESTCDGMLTSERSLILVELKNRGKHGYFAKGEDQLRNTIGLIQSSHSLNYKYKKAYVCNKRHPHFTTLDNEMRRRFFHETDGFRIDNQSRIVIT
jgi:hypothetical protein